MAGPQRWFEKRSNPDLIARSTSYLCTEAVPSADSADWLATPKAALALALLLDQFPRNAFRGTSRMYASHAMARDTVVPAIELGHDLAVEAELRTFFYLPFGHWRA